MRFASVVEVSSNLAKGTARKNKAHFCRHVTSRRQGMYATQRSARWNDRAGGNYNSCLPQRSTYSIAAMQANKRVSRAIQFSIFPSSPCLFDSFPPGGGRAPVKLGALCPRSGRERGHVKLCPLRRRSRGERLGWGEKHSLGTPSVLTPTLALPHLRGRESRRENLYFVSSLTTAVASQCGGSIPRHEVRLPLLLRLSDARGGGRRPATETRDRCPPKTARGPW
jgi:hypothetical protein